MKLSINTLIDAQTPKNYHIVFFLNVILSIEALVVCYR